MTDHTDHTDHYDAEPTGEEYEPPRAVYLSELAAGAGRCSQGTADNACEDGPTAGQDCNFGTVANCCLHGPSGTSFGPRPSPRHETVWHLGPTKT